MEPKQNANEKREKGGVWKEGEEERKRGRREERGERGGEGETSKELENTEAGMGNEEKRRRGEKRGVERDRRKGG